MIKQPNILYSKGLFFYDFDFGIWTQTFQISLYIRNICRTAENRSPEISQKQQYFT